MNFGGPCPCSVDTANGFMVQWVKKTPQGGIGLSPNETFEDWWSRKTMLKKHLLEGLNSENLDVLELLRGVNKVKIRKEILQGDY